ncbi:MAG: glycoside hydrolase family 5 protein [Saprospiraceae bacterium]|nr:glycoside hydrolase family 5 protein [Saprospiraceae bacterium]
MKSLSWLSLVFAALVIICSVSVDAQKTLSKISVSGNQFVKEDGSKFIFRGLNTSDPERLSALGHWNEAYFDQMKKWGANIVRFPVHPSAWRKLGKQKYMQLLDKGIKWASVREMYVIIDWHSIGNLKNEMFQADNYETTKKETFEFWRAIAMKYKGDNTVAFYELFNEPTVYNGQLGTCSWDEWKVINEEMITIIRANGGSGIPLVAGFNWAYDLVGPATNPINAEGIGYVSHPYPMKREKPWEEKWTQDWGFLKNKYPVILTEIGFCGPEDPGAHIPVISDESYGDAITTYCDKNDISWVVWVFDPEWAPALFSDWKFTPTRQGIYFKKALNDRK